MGGGFETTFMLLVFPSNLHLYYIDIEIVNSITAYLYDEPMHEQFGCLKDTLTVLQ